MSGRDEDFTMIIAIGYTGLRWGEAIGLERDYVRLGEIHVEWRLREIGGVFHRLPPKDDSYRSPLWEPCLPVDLPPFLDGLIANQLQRQNEAGHRCPCAGLHGGGGQYLFLSPDGDHHRRSNYARRVFRPATAGRHEATGSRPARVVIADATTWPGIPIAAWPPAQPGASYAPPAAQGVTTIPDSAPLACWTRLLAPLREAASQSTADPEAPEATVHNLSAPGGREKLTSQIPPRYAQGLTLEVG